MDNINLLLSIMFFIVCIVSSFLGVYTLYLDSKSRLNWVFLLCSISLSLWAFGFSIANSAPDLETCLFWRRISALGWGTMFTNLLLFFVCLTERAHYLKKWWSYLFLLPGLISIYIFAISNKFAVIQYRFVHTALGWTNIAVNNFWDQFFYFYYVGYMIIGLSLLWQWRVETKDINKRKQANIILISFIFALIVGSITDIIGNSVLSLGVPQMAPVIILIPATAIFYSIRKYSFLNSDTYFEEELILTEANNRKIYNYISVAFVAGGFLNFIAMYLLFENADLASVLLLSAILFSLGIILQVIRRSALKENTKFNLFIIINTACIPILTLKFIEFGSITIWAISFILIIGSLIFSNRKALILISLTAIATQIVIWFLAPETLVTVDRVDYIGRIGFLCITACFASLINRIYILRLKENADQIRLQTLISQISTSFVSINEENFNIKIDNMLEQCGQFFKTDRTSIALFDADFTKMTYSHEWYQTEPPVRNSIVKETMIDRNLSWIQALLSNEVVFYPDSNRDSDIICEIPYPTQNNGQNHSIIIPIYGKQVLLGLLQLDLQKSPKHTREEYINPLRTIANIFGDALVKVNSEKEINYLAYYDALTKLPNRILFKDRLSQALLFAQRNQKMVGVVFLDLDSFKFINDSMGHNVGDEILIQIGKALVQQVRKCDTVSRFGGDEFLIIINDAASRRDIIKVVDKIIGIFKNPFIFNEQEFFVTASAGIAAYPIDGDTTEVLVKNADIAMYSAKEKGKNQYVMCSSIIKDEVQMKIKLTNSLYHALEKDELLIYYQPQVNLLSKEILGFEALLRWNNPEHGMIPPNVFIPLAEQTGLINSIGEWVIKKVCQQNKKWQDMGLTGRVMAVNLSINQFVNSNVVSQVEYALKESGLEPEFLELEITEGVAITESNHVINILNDLKNLGVLISIDDFGTEYSSLSRLKMLPADRIKIDIQFIRGIGIDYKDEAITDTIIQLAKNLGLKVVAEGVEQKHQVDFLAIRGCHEVQGYYFYEPMLPEDIERILIEKLT